MLLAQQSTSVPFLTRFEPLKLLILDAVSVACRQGTSSRPATRQSSVHWSTPCSPPDRTDMRPLANAVPPTSPNHRSSHPRAVRPTYVRLPDQLCNRFHRRPGRSITGPCASGIFRFWPCTHGPARLPAARPGPAALPNCSPPAQRPPAAFLARLWACFHSFPARSLL